MNSLRYEAYKLLTKSHLISSKVIVLLDGGICSQMHQYLLGHCYVMKGERVYYDLSFFEEWGSDLNSHFARNFDLLKAFPYLSFKEASKTMLEVYRKKYYNEGNNTEGNIRTDDYSFLQKTAPVYLGGYYQLPVELWLESFRSLFRLVPDILDTVNRELYDDMTTVCHSVAVHVRRGDLKEEVFAYGKPATLDYFRAAVRFFNEKLSTPYFYFFSDEPDWVEEVLIHDLPLSTNCKVVNINGSDRGYMDLYLIAACKHQITSKGTLGKYGALLMDCPQKYVVLCDDVTEYSWKELLYNPICL